MLDGDRSCMRRAFRCVSLTAPVRATSSVARLSTLCCVVTAPEEMLRFAERGRGGELHEGRAMDGTPTLEEVERMLS